MSSLVIPTFEFGTTRTENVALTGFTFYLSKRGGANAFGTLTFSGNAANTNTVVIGGKTYTFLTSLTQLDGSVLIGASIIESIINLSNAINLGPGGGTLYGSLTTQHANVISIAGTSTDIIAFSREIGTGGNAITTTQTLVAGLWGGATLAGGTFLAEAQDNEFVVTLPTNPVDGLNYKWVTEDDGITKINEQLYFTNWRINSPISDGFVVRKGGKTLLTTPTDNKPFTVESLIIGFSGTTQSSERRYQAGETLELTFFNGKWRGNLTQGSNILGIGEI